MIIPVLAVRVLGERRGGLAGWATGLVLLITVQVSVYPTIRDSREGWSNLTEEFPEAFRKMFRMQDYTSPGGYLTTELFSFMVPLIFIGLATTWGARAGAEEDENGTADVLFSLPVPRNGILLTRISAMVAVVLGMAATTTVALLIGTEVVDMDVGIKGIASAALTCAALGTVFGSVSLALSCWTGRRGVGLGAGLGLAIALFVTYSLAPLVPFFDTLLPVNPYQWTIGQNPLTRGLDPSMITVPIAVCGVLMAASSVLNARRDIRT